MRSLEGGGLEWGGVPRVPGVADNEIAGDWYSQVLSLLLLLVLVVSLSLDLVGTGLDVGRSLCCVGSSRVRGVGRHLRLVKRRFSCPAGVAFWSALKAVTTEGHPPGSPEGRMEQSFDSGAVGWCSLMACSQVWARCDLAPQSMQVIPGSLEWRGWTSPGG